jgi:transporter family-2 protein
VASSGTHHPGLADPLAVGASVGAGFAGAVQPEINSELGRRLDSSLLAALVNFAVALLCAVVVVTRRPGTRHHLRTIPSWPVPRWTFLAGLGGVTVVMAGVVSIETLGVAVFSVAFFAGQMTSGLLVDRLGIAPGAPRLITRTRVVAVAIALVAVVLSQLGQPVGDVAPALVAFVVGAGAASALQAACNARITSSIGDPMAATTVNVVVGAVCLGAIALIGAVTGVIDGPDWPSEPWLYVGGVLGVSIVLALAAASAAIGVLRTTLAMLAAQLVGAFLVDWVRRDEAPTVGVLLGASLTVVAVLLVSRDRARAAARATASAVGPDARAEH